MDIEDGPGAAHPTGQVVAHGATSLRRWQIVRGPSGVRLHLWTPWFERVLVLVVIVALAMPLPALWNRALAAPRIGAWVLATVASLLVVYVGIWLLRRSARESVTVTSADVVVTGPGLLWRRVERLGREGGTEVHVAGGTFLELRLSLGVETSGRYVAFGGLLTREAAGRVREHLRAAADSRAPDLGVADGVVRRVAARDGPGTARGTEQLLVHERRKPSVIGGALRMEHGASGVGEVVYLLGLLASVAWAVGSAFGRGHGAASVVLVLLLLVGVGLGRHGLLDLLRRRRAARLRARHPREPWRAVPLWSGGVVRRSPLSRASGPGLIALLLAGIVVWIFVAAPGRSAGARTVFAAIFGLLAVVNLYRTQNLLFQGTTEVHVGEVPCRVPGDVILGFAVSRRGAAFDTIRFTLQRIVEVRRLGRNPVVGCTHVGTYIPDSEHAVLDPGGQIEARFTVPEDAGGTRLDADAPAWWELLVEGRTSCGRYSESFPVPLYDREVPPER